MTEQPEYKGWIDMVNNPKLIGNEKPYYVYKEIEPYQNKLDNNNQWLNNPWLNIPNCYADYTQTFMNAPFSPAFSVLKEWGEYTDIYRSETTVLKKIIVYPGHRFSYQYHNNRREFWSVESGEGYLTLNDELFKVGPGFSVFIERLDRHRMRNTGTEKLVFYEIQSGKCSEEDIVRLCDDYGRT